ncbi:hypothetical protein AgCh_038853 [Apium graveolens]
MQFRDLRLPKIILETDSLDTTNCIYSGDVNHAYSHVVDRIKELPRRPWRISFTHIFREAADFLANLGLDNGFGVEVLYEPPESLANLLLLDIQGAPSFRSLASSPRLVGPRPPRNFSNP